MFDSIFLRYNNASEVSPIQPSNEIKAWNDQITKLLPRDDLSVYEAPAVLEKYPRLKQLSRTTSLPKPTKFIILNVTEQFTDARSGQNLRDATSKNGFYRWTINGMSHNQASTPLLLASYYDVLDRVYSNGMMKPYRLEYGDVVQLVIQNQAKETGECDVHTWHLHGYDFWILGYGEGTFDPRVHEETLNTINPFTSDSVLSFPTNFTMLRGREYPEFDRDNGIKSCGWTVIRFVADNPGMWHFHCHLDWDMALGMGLVFDVASELLWENMTLTLPYNHELCGLIDRNTINPRLEKKLANEECINYCNSEKVHNRHQDLRLILSHLIVVLFGIACGFLWNRKCFAQKPIKNSSYEIEMYSTTSRGNWLPFSRGFQRLNSDSVHEKDPTINTIHDTQDQQENNHAS